MKKGGLRRGAGAGAGKIFRIFFFRFKNFAGKKNSIAKIFRKIIFQIQNFCRLKNSIAEISGKIIFWIQKFPAHKSPGEIFLSCSETRESPASAALGQAARRADGILLVPPAGFPPYHNFPWNL